MQASLDQMIQFCARQTKRTEDVVKSGEVYIDEALSIVNNYIDGINYAKNKIVKERYKPLFKEKATVGNDNTIRLTSLTETVLTIKNIYYAGTYDTVFWQQGAGYTVEFLQNLKGLEVDIEYVYIIADFPTNPTKQDLETILELPDLIDYKTLCYYACYAYHLIKGSDKDLEKTQYFANLWNDGLLHIPSSVKRNKKVKDTAGY